jgi:frataxin
VISVYTRRAFSTTRIAYKSLSPEFEDSQPKETEDHAAAAAAAVLTIEQYNELSDEYMNAMVEKLEQVQEEREDVDVEYSAGVLTFSFPPIGTYVINKQPPNKQIWLSSPISGPKRYDFVIMSEGQDSKEGTGAGDWVYLRDGSCLGDVLLKEVGVDLTELATPVPHFRE